ncbi:MAG TPA: 7-cyano-7-deazaguanine synthase QueC [Pseudobdellovibrionaceae bacterium]|jgi:7-cyano-7-deazaguanine synthase
MRRKAVVLLSSGLDSSVNLFEAHQKEEVVLALTFGYGQKAAKKEIECAAKLAATLGIPHKVLSLPWFKDFNKSSLLVDSEKVPTGAEVNILSHEQSLQTAKSVWVPNRNGIFLNIGAAFAEALGATLVIPGFNAEEATTFPDNSEAFMKVLTTSLSYSTANHVQVECYTVKLQKIDIVKKGISLNMPWHLLWPCYFSQDKWCGQCESCLRSKRAFVAAGVDVASLYMA